MATSLEAQLKKLSGPATSQFESSDLKKPSLLFDQREAAKYDVSDIYGIGIAGLQELQILNPAFASFEATLFSEASQSIERSVQSQDLNKKLDLQIAQFLKLISPYILLRPTIKALEWLIVRFRIHQYNQDDVLRAFLPYHETNIFVRMIQLLEFHQTERWAWLTGIRQKGVPLTKRDLLRIMLKNQWLLSFLCDAVISHVDRRKTGQESIVSNDIFLKFFASTILAFIHNTTEVDNTLISVLLPCASKCIYSPDVDYRITGYSIIASLSTVSDLTAKTIHAVLLAVAHSAVQFADENGIKCLAVILDKYGGNESPVSMSDLFRDDKLKQLCLTSIEKYQLQNLHWFLLKNCIDGLFSMKDDWFADVLTLFMSEESLMEPLKEKAMDYLVYGVLGRVKSVGKVGLGVGKVLSRLRLLAPSHWCKLLEERGKEHEHLLEKLDLVMMEAANSLYSTDATDSALNIPPNTALFLRLNHPNAVVRIKAVEELMASGKGVGEEFLKDMIKTRMSDKDPEIVLKILARKDVLRQAFGAELRVVIHNLLFGVYAEKYSTEKSYELETAALNVLADFEEISWIVPFFLMSVLRRNPHETPEKLREVFSKSVLADKEGSLESIAEVIEQDFRVMSQDVFWDIPSVLDELCNSVDPYNRLPVLWTLHFIVRKIGYQHMFFTKLECVGLLDLIRKFLTGLKLSQTQLGEHPLEKAARMIGKAKIPVTFIVSWFEHLWNDKAVANMDQKVLLRTTQFLFSDLRMLTTDRICQKALIYLFSNRILNHLAAVPRLLEALLAQEKIQLGLCRVVLRMVAAALKGTPKETVPNQLAGDLVFLMLPFLAMEDQQTRKAAVDILQQLKDNHKLQSKEFEKLVEVFMENRDPIEVEASAANQVLAEAFAKAPQKTEKTWLDCLSKSVTTSHFPKLIAARILGASRSVMPAAVTSALIPTAKSILDQYDAAGLEDVSLLSEFFERDVVMLSRSSGILKKEEQGTVLNLVLKGLKLERKGQLESPAEIIVRQISLLTRDDVGAEQFDRVLEEIIRVYVDKSNKSVIGAAHRYLKHVKMPSKVILNLLGSKSDQKKPGAGNALGRINNPLLKTVEYWNRVASILEIVQSKKKLTEQELLIEGLFNVARETVVVESRDEELLKAVEKVRQLIFSTLSFHCRRVGAEKLNERIVQAPVIVECIRYTTDSQTFLHALSLLSTLAELMPQSVIQSCLSIFTLTGSKLMAREDQYSTEVVGRTVDVIVPVMMDANPTNRHDAVREVLSVFLDSLPHMPIERRQYLFKRVLNVINAEEHLWILVVLTINLYVSKGLPIEEDEPNKRKSYPIMTEFLVHLLEEQPANGVLENLNKTYDALYEAYIPKALDASKSEGSKSKKQRRLPSFAQPILNEIASVEEQIRSFTAIFNLIPIYLASIREEKLDLMDQELQLLFARLLSFQSVLKSLAKQKPLWNGIAPKVSLALVEVLGRMSWRSFVKVMLDLMGELDLTMLRGSLEQLGGVLSFRAGVRKEDVPELLPLVKTLTDVAEKQNLDSEGFVIQRGCLFCLKELAGVLGKESPKSSMEIADFSLKYLDSTDISVQAEAFDAIAAVVATLKTALLPRLPKMLPKLLNSVWNVLMKEKLEMKCVFAAIGALEVLATSLAAFLSSQLPIVLLILAKCSVTSFRDTTQDPVSVKLEKIRNTICEQIPFRVLLNSFSEALARLDREPETYPVDLRVPLFGILNAGLKAAKTVDILAVQKDVVEMLLDVFERRGEELEEAIRSLTSIAVRMPESAFKGLFMRVYQWAIEEEAPKHRRLTFFEMLNGLADTLKHLFTLFAATAISQATKEMNERNVLKDGKGRGKKERKLDTNVLREVFAMLTKFFKYDATGFFNSDQCEMIMQPLVDQLENFYDKEAYESLLPGLIEAISALVVCLNDDSLWKPLHYQVCLKARSSEPSVRVGALKCLESLVEAMGENYIGLFPEAVSFLVELSTDEDERVENQCLKTKETIERVLGDSEIWKDYV